MADAVKELLSRWTLDLSSWPASVKQAQKTISDAAKADATRATASAKATQTAITLLQKEIALKQQSTQASATSVAAEKAKTSEISKQAQASVDASKQALAAINLQISAEKLKAATAKTALAEQRRSAQEAVLIAKNAMQQQKQIAADAAAATKAAFSETTRVANTRQPRQNFAQIPIVSAVEPRKELPARSVPSRIQETPQKAPQTTGVAGIPQASTTSAAAVASNATAVESAESAELVAAAQSATKDAVDATTASYQKLAAATTEVIIANTNLAETQAAIRNGTLEEGAAQQRLAQDLMAVDQAKTGLAEVQAAMAAETAAVEEAATKRIAVEEAEQARIAAVRARGLASLNVYLSEEDAVQEAHSARQSMYGGGGGNHGISNRQAVAGDLRAFSGSGGSYRAAETFATMIPGAAALAQAVFPVAGAAALVGMIGEGVSKLVEFTKQLQEMPDAIRRAFENQNLEVEKSTDELQKATDTTNASIDKMLHRSQANNTTKIAIDDARIAADELASAADAAYEKTKKLLEANSVGDWGALWANIKNMFPGTDAASDTTKNLAGTVISYEQQIRDLKFNLQEATRHGTPEDVTKAQNNLNAKQGSYRNYMQKDLASRTGYTQNQFGMPVQITAEEYANLKKQGATNIQSADENRAANANNIAIAQGVLTGMNNDDAHTQAKAADDKAKLTQKQIEQSQQSNRDALSAAEAHYSALKELAANNLSQEKLDIQAADDAEEQRYKSGQDSAQKYYAAKDAMSKKTLNATLADIAIERDADLALLSQRRSTDPTLRGRKYSDEQQKINSQYDLKTNTAQSQYTRETNQSALGLNAYNTQQQVAELNAQTDAKIKAIDLQTQAVKDSFKEQTIDAETYLQTSLALINQETKAKTESINAQIALEGQYSTKAIELRKSLVDVTAEANAKLLALSASAPQTRYESENSRYSQQTAMLQLQQQAIALPASGAGYATQVGNVNAQMGAAMAHMFQLQAQAAKVSPTSGTSDPALWQQLQQEILKTSNAFDQLSLQMREMSNPVSQFGGTISAGVSGLSQVFTSRYAQGLEGSLTAGAASAQSAPTTMGNFTASAQDFGSNMFGGAPLADTFGSFNKMMQSATKVVGSFVSSIANSGSASAGGLAGGMSGAGLGQSLGSSMGGPNGPLSGLGQMAGPLGALVGGGAGAALGAIMGQKQETVQNDLNKLNVTFTNTMAMYSSNNSSLANTIANLQNLIAQAQADMASTKKGSSQFQSLIQQYNQQITQLEDQQKQQMAQLTDSLTTLGQASPYQTMLSNIQSILTQYEQFAGAAQNATQLAQANQFLTSSLQQLGVTYSQQLLQDETTAVQDALQLNQLYNQRNQLTQQFLQQTQQIAGQGTLTRGITQSQSKFSQLYNLDVNYNQQMLQLNEQVAATQYRVQAEQQIFNLATTQQGLETQLLGLQQQGINQDMARIAAMQNLLGVLQSTGYSITNLSGVNSSDPNATITLLLQLLTAMLGNGSAASTIAGSNGNSLLSTILGSAYSNQVGLGYGAYTGTNIS